MNLNQLPEFVVFGHRGAPQAHPENTLPSFESAIQAGVPAIELDVQWVNGQLLVFHDTTLERLTDKTGYLDEYSLEQIKKLLIGGKEKLPTLAEVLDLVQRRVIVNIELKSSETAHPVATLIEYYVTTHQWDYSQFLVSSFNHHMLLQVQQQNPNIPIGVLLNSIPIDYSKCAKDLKAYSIHLSQEFINDAFVQDAHANGLKVFTFTINRERDFRRVKAMGVDGVFTDVPEQVFHYLMSSPTE